MLKRKSGCPGLVLERAPATSDKLVVEQTEKWGRVIRAANIKVD
jgi:hypothetical protein